MGYQDELNKAMVALGDVTIISAQAFEPSKTVLVIFKLEDNELWLAEQNMKAIVGAVQAIGTDGKRLRLAAKMENGLTGLTITLSADAVAALDCSVDVVDWGKIAEEYNVAKGLL